MPARYLAFGIFLACLLPGRAIPPPQDPEPPPLAELHRRGGGYLLRHQEKDGSWIADPSYLDPKGMLMMAPPRNIFVDDSLAVTALAARALLRSPAGDVEAAGAAVRRGFEFLQQTLAAEKDRFRTPTTSPIWQAYALDFLLELERTARPGLEAARREAAAWIERVVACVAAGECKEGGWTYTYYDSSKGTPRTFCTALVVRTLAAVRARGHRVPEGLLERGRALLDRAALEGGGYRYLCRRSDWPPRATPMGSAGRMALIESARLAAGGGDRAALAAAVAGFFAHRGLLDEAVRQQTRFGNEGCHHFFAYYHLAEALRWLPAKEHGTQAGEVVDHLRRTIRPDGSWWDSKRAGPGAATAMALLALAAAGERGV